MSALISATHTPQQPAPPVTLREGRFVMGLWGNRNTLQDFRPNRWLEKTAPEIRDNGMRLAKSLDAAVYGIGQEAIDVLVSAGTGLAINVLPEPPGNLWIAKMVIIRDAIKRFGSIVWLDGDATQLASLPDDFWPVLHERAPMQVKIRGNFRRKCHWRYAQYRDPAKANERVCPSGAFIYCRDIKIIDRVIELMVEKSSDKHCLHGWDDQIAMAYVIDHDLTPGGWQGVEYYHERFDPPWYQIGGEIFKCEKGKAIFTAH